MTDTKSEYLYGIEKTQEDPLKIFIIQDRNERPKNKVVKDFYMAHIEQLSKPIDITAVLDKHEKKY